MLLVLDTNVLVYAFVSPEFVPTARKLEWVTLNKNARTLYEDILAGRHELIIPSSVLIEMATVISAMCDEEQARRDVNNVKDNAIVVYDDPIFTDQAIAHALSLKLSGFDTAIASCTIMNNATLITNDRAFYEKFSSRARDFRIRVLFFRELSEKQIRELA